MARPKKSEREGKVFDRAYREFDRIQSAAYDERRQCLQDRRFARIAGAQYEGPLEEQFAAKPKMEVNKIQRAITRVINEMRQNEFTSSFIMRDGEDDPELSDLCCELKRADEHDSNAQESIDVAFDEALTGGFGAYRLCTEYVDENDPDDERQRVRWEPINDADSCVFFDVDSKKQDKSDARHVFVLTPYTLERFVDEWGDDPASWPKAVTQSEFDWSTGTIVWVAEFYEVEEKRVTTSTFMHVDGKEEKRTDEELAEVVQESDDGEGMTLEAVLESQGARKVREKKTKVRKVHKWIMSGGGILKDCGYIAGTELPIIPVFGIRVVVDGVERPIGLVRYAKDIQRLKNMAMSKLAEVASLGSVEKPIFIAGQVAGHENIWRDDNLQNYPYLTINPIVGEEGVEQPMGPVGYTKSPNVPPAVAGLLQTTDADMAEVLGNQGGADQMQANTSAKLFENVSERLDAQSYIFMDNLAKARRREAQVWLSMARDIYREKGRKMKAIGADDEPRQVEIKRPVMNEETGEREYENDLDDADFDVFITVGPTSASKRRSVVTQAVSLMQVSQDPQTQNILAMYAMMNLDGEGMSDLAAYARKQLVQMGVVKPTEAEREEMAQAAAQAKQQPPDAQQQFLMAEAQKAKVLAQKAAADTALAMANTEKAKVDAEAKRVETLLAVNEQALAVAEARTQGLGNGTPTK